MAGGASRRAVPIIPYIPFPSGTVQVAAGGLTAAAIGADAITAAKIADNAIDAGAIADNAIDAGAIAAGALTAAKFAASALAGQLIKSIQAFTITIAAASSTQTQAITAVDLSKSFIAFCGYETDTNSAVQSCRVIFTSNVQIQARRSGTAGSTSVSGFVVEFQ